MQALSIPLLLIALMLPALANGEQLYRWTDARGTLHMTESLDQVPVRYRTQAAERTRQPAHTRKVQRYYSPKPQRRYVAALNISSLSRPSGTNGIIVPFEREGNLMKVNVRLNDHVVAPFYVDTGASDISLPRSVAQQLGVDGLSALPKAIEITASGAIQVPIIKLDSVQLGDAHVENLLATINPMLEVGLLGGSFFNHFSYSVDPSARIIVLRPN